MYSSDASQRIVKKSVYRTAPPFSTLNVKKCPIETHDGANAKLNTS
jgi:hypothetical protein